MKKSKKAKAPEREDGGVDRISNLPDPILQLILSRLEGTEEVIRTSILSTRWKNLWTSVPSIDINCFRGLKPQIFKSNQFKEFVYWVLANKSLDLDRFRLFCLDYYSMSTLRRWIHIAVTKNVRYLDLVFCPRKKSVSVELPHCLVNCGSLEVLKLSLFGRRLYLPDSTGFRALAVLVLCKVELFNDYSVKCFFENLPVLEGLALFDCYTHKLYSLNISCPNLKSLTIRSREGVGYEEFCKGKGMCGDLVISCPKLAVLDLRGYVASVMSFEGLDSLWDVQIHPQELDEDEQPLTDGFNGLRNVVAMSISLYTIAMCYYPPEDTLVSLPNLKLLELTTGVFTMAILIPFLKCLPDLESLHLIISWVDNLEDWKLDDNETMGILTRCLKSVDFLGFDGDEQKVVVARSLLEHGNHLEEMVFAWYVEDEHHDKSIKAMKEIENFHKASSTVKFRCTEL